MSTLRYRQDLVNRLKLVLVVLLILLSVVATYLLITSLFSLNSSIPFVSLTLLIVLLFGALLVGNGFIVGQSYHINFHETFFETQGRHPLFQKPFKCTYDHVLAVERLDGGLGVQIVSRTGETLILYPKLFEGGETNFFATLSQRIPAERFEPDLRNTYRKVNIVVGRTYFIGLAFMLLAAAMLFFQNQLFFIPFSWNHVGSWESLSNSVVGASIESSDSIWIAKRDFTSDTVIVEHLWNHQTQTWSLLDKDNQMIVGAPRILVDSHGQPVLLTRENVQLLKDGQWQKQNYGIGYRSSPYSYNTLFVFANDCWMTIDNIIESPSKELLVHIQADDPKPQVVTLLDPVTQKSLTPESILTAADGTTLLRQNNIIYLLRDGKVQPQRYIASSQALDQIADFTLTDDGTVYVLFSAGYGSDNFVEKIDAQGTHVSTRLPLLQQGNGHYLRYNSIEVDVHGRLWITGTVPSFVSVVEPSWGGQGREIVKYDRYNSSYQDGLYTELLRTQDGRMWSADHYLVWVDSNAAQLPMPLPDWLAALRNIQVSWAITIVLNMIGTILMVLNSWHWHMKRRKKHQHLLTK